MVNKHSYITPEFQMVLAIVKAILIQSNASLPEIAVDNTKLIQFIRRNNLTAFIAANIDQFPELEKIKIPLIRSAKKALHRNLMLQADLIKLIDLANEHNIDLVLFKGHPINEFIYDKKSVRTSTDIDIFILPEDLHKLENILLEKGYTIDSPDFDLDPKEFELFLKIENEKSYTSPSKSKLDVHFRLFRNPYLLQLPIDKTKYLVKENYSNREIIRMNNEYTLLYLMLHGKSHYWDKMMWLIDIVIFLDKFSKEELKRAYELAKNNNIENVFLGTISLCNVAFEMPIPEALLGKINNKQASYVLQGLTSLASGKTSKASKWKQRVLTKKVWRFFIYQISLFPLRDIKIIKIPIAKRVLYPLLRPITYLFS